jgi:hypothetical protein
MALPVSLSRRSWLYRDWLHRGAWRRWSLVLSGTVALCAVPAVIAALPVPASTISAASLRARILASASHPYQAYAESTINLGLPQLPHLHDVSNLLDGTTDQYVWYQSPDYWRADVVTGTGESDTYTDGGVTYLWNYGSNLLTQVTGPQPVRLPRAADLLPPALALRLLHTAGAADHYSRLPSRRVAGVAAAGLRLVPASRGTTIGAIDIWADPRTGLPVEVQVSARGSAAPVLTSTLLELTQTDPGLGAVIPHPAPQLGITTTRLPNVDGVLNGDGDGDNDGTPFPLTLAGLSHVAIPGRPPGVAVYGTGFSRLVLLPLPSNIGNDAQNAAIQAGADTIALAGQTTGVLIRTPLINVLMVRAGSHHATFLFAGAVTPALLRSAASNLVTDLSRLRFGIHR